jgi:hypothetical protein
MERQTGYYWVFRKRGGLEWEPARWDADLKSWRLIATRDETYDDADLAKIGPRIEPPAEG